MTNERMQYGGVNHVALVARDMAETVDFYERVLEMPLVKTVEFAGGRGQHFFFDCGGGGTLAFFWFPDAPPAAPGIASMHEDVRKNGSMTAIASMNHLAISIPLEKFDDYVARLKAKGLKPYVINHDDSPAGARGRDARRRLGALDVLPRPERHPHGTRRLHPRLAPRRRRPRPDERPRRTRGPPRDGLSARRSPSTPLIPAKAGTQERA